MKQLLKSPLPVIIAIILWYLCFVGYVKIKNHNPLYIDYRYNHAIIYPMAKKGWTNAEYKMGLYHLYRCVLVPTGERQQQAIYWLKKAAAKGHNTPAKWYGTAAEELKIAENPELYPDLFFKSTEQDD